MRDFHSKSQPMHFAALTKDIGFTVLDIGARGGVSQDFNVIQPAVDFVLFEPDPEERARLEQAPPPVCRSIRYIPHAVGEREHDFTLNLYRQRGCSSRFQADETLGNRFARGEYYLLDDQVTVHALPLDTILSDAGIDSPAFLKIDIQGMEIEGFSGAKRALAESLVGIRTEVSFFPIYKGQPLFAEVDQHLRAFGFAPMHWLEFHEWRRTTRAKYPKLSQGPLPYSRGQMIHADVLYLLQPEDLPDDTDEQLKRLVRLGIASACFDQLDHAYATFSLPRVREYCRRIAGLDPVDTVISYSDMRARQRFSWKDHLIRLLLGKSRKNTFSEQLPSPSTR